MTIYYYPSIRLEEYYYNLFMDEFDYITMEISQYIV